MISRGDFIRSDASSSRGLSKHWQGGACSGSFPAKVSPSGGGVHHLEDVGRDTDGQVAAASWRSVGMGLAVQLCGVRKLNGQGESRS